MKIRFKKKRLEYNLVFGILWLIVGATSLIFSLDNLFNFGYLIFGTIYLGIYAFEYNKQYLTIENGIISQNHIISTKINLKDIKHIKKFAGDYVLNTYSTEMNINTNFIEKTSLYDLEIILENLNLEIN